MSLVSDLLKAMSPANSSARDQLVLLHSPREVIDSAPSHRVTQIDFIFLPLIYSICGNFAVIYHCKKSKSCLSLRYFLSVTILTEMMKRKD